MRDTKVEIFMVKPVICMSNNIVFYLLVEWKKEDTFRMLISRGRSVALKVENQVARRYTFLALKTNDEPLSCAARYRIINSGLDPFAHFHSVYRPRGLKGSLA